MPAAATDKFVPLASAIRPGAPDQNVFRPRVLSSANAASGSDPTKPGSAPHPLHAPGAAQPVVTLKREGDVVTGIRIQCACGQVLELACAY